VRPAGYYWARFAANRYRLDTGYADPEVAYFDGKGWRYTVGSEDPWHDSYAEALSPRLEPPATPPKEDVK